MSDNPYAPTEVRVADPTSDETPFYVVSTTKFSVLYLSTVGLYAVYWFYENWRRYRVASGESIWPVARAIFSIFFIHRLFEKVNDQIVRDRATTDWGYVSHATVLVICFIVSTVLDRLAGKGIGSPTTDLLGILMLVPLWLLQLRAQRYINLACKDEAGSGNARFTAANYAWITFGAVIWLLAFVGLVLPEG